MTGAESLMNTVINSLSMIDRGFTVTLTVTPHDWYGDEGDYDEEDDDEDEEDDEEEEEPLLPKRDLAPGTKVIEPEVIEPKKDRTGVD